MFTHEADLARLALLIRRMRDADALCDVEAEALLTDAEAAHRCLEADDARAARRHIAQVARLTERLVDAAILAPADGQAIIETVRRLLAEEPDGPA